MPEYTITITKTAQKQLDKLTDNVAEPIFEAIQNLAHNPRPHGCIKLKGRDSYRIRKGKYRIIYDIYDKILNIDVVAIGHRKHIYK
jgi:mRNA interferase RelE/StbE